MKMPSPNVSMAGFQVLTRDTNTTSWVGAGPKRAAKAAKSATEFHFCALFWRKIVSFFALKIFLFALKIFQSMFFSKSLANRMKVAKFQEGTAEIKCNTASLNIYQTIALKYAKKN